METLKVQWVLDGLRMLVLADKRLLLYQHKSLTMPPAISGGIEQYSQQSTTANTPVRFTLSAPPEDATTDEETPSSPLVEESVWWTLVWQVELSAAVKHVKFAPDGTRFATCGEEDRFVKIWYQEKGAELNQTRHSLTGPNQIAHPSSN